MVVRKMVVSVLIGLSGFLSAAEKDARSFLVMEPHILYENALIDLEKRDWERVKKTMNLLQPLFMEIDPEKLISLEEAIDQLNQDRSKRLLIEVVGLGVVMRLKNQSVGEQAKVVVQESFAEYLAIEPYIRKVNSALSQSLISDFKALHFVCHRNSPERTTVIQKIESNFDLAASLVKGAFQ